MYYTLVDLMYTTAIKSLKKAAGLTVLGLVFILFPMATVAADIGWIGASWVMVVAAIILFLVVRSMEWVAA